MIQFHSRSKLIRIVYAIILVLFTGFVLSVISNPSYRLLGFVLALAGGFALIILPPDIPLRWLIFMLPFPMVMQAIGFSLSYAAIVCIGFVSFLKIGDYAHTQKRFAETCLILFVVYNVLAGTIFSPQTISAHISSIITLITCFVLFKTIQRTVVDESLLWKSLVVFSIATTFAQAISLLTMIFPHNNFFPGLLSNAGTMSREGNVLSFRLGGVIGDYELFAEYSLLSGLIQLYLLLFDPVKRRSIFWAILLLFSVLILFLTGTRAAFLLFVLGIVSILLFTHKLSIRRVVIVLSSAGGLYLFIALLLPIFQSSYRSGLLLDRFLSGEYGGDILTLINRKTVWEHMWPYFDWDWSLVFGHGPGYPYDMIQQYPHSLPLFIIYTSGVIGLSLFYGFLVSTLFKLKSLMNKTEANNYIVLFFVVLTIFIIDEFKIEYVRQFNYQFVVWYILGLTYAALNIAGVKMSKQVI